MNKKTDPYVNGMCDGCVRGSAACRTALDTVRSGPYTPRFRKVVRASGADTPSACGSVPERIVDVAKKASSGKSGRSPAGKASGTRSTKSAKKTAKKPARKAAKTPAKKVAKKAVKAARKTAKKPAKKAKAPTSRAKLKSPLTRPRLRKFRQMLLEKRHDLVGDMTGIEASALHKNGQGNSGDLSSVPTHPADIGTDNYEQEFTLGLLESERALLAEIDAALGRIEAGTFGICLGTGEAIGVVRLKARPWAKYCIDYARMLEKGLVRRDDDRESAIAAGTVYQPASDLDDGAGEE